MGEARSDEAVFNTKGGLSYLETLARMGGEIPNAGVRAILADRAALARRLAEAEARATKLHGIARTAIGALNASDPRAAEPLSNALAAALAGGTATHPASPNQQGEQR